MKREQIVEIRLKQIDKEIDSLHKIISEKDKKWDFGRPFNEYREYLSKEYNQISKLDQESRMIMPYKLSDLPDYGLVMSLKHFIDNVKCGGFVDSDGIGYYVKDSKESDIIIRPSDIEDGVIRPDFDTIVWYNK